MALRVLHLVGSADTELLAELSRLYARDCLSTVEDPGRYEPVIAHVTPDRSWSFPATLQDDAIARASRRSLSISEAARHIASLAIDVAVPQMFCLPGMTEYRALLDRLAIPYLGNPPAVMALGADKARAKAVVAGAGVAVPAGELVSCGQTPTLTPPAIVKPVDGDNSLGLTLVTDPRDYPAAVDDACAHGSAALVERYIELGREVRCGVLDLDGRLRCLPLEEYAVSRDAKPIRGAADKLARGEDGTLALVAKERTRAWLLDAEDPACAPVWEAARRCHRALGCRHYSLFDFRIDPDGRPWFLEAGLYCSFARQSVVATMARGAGIDTAELFASVVHEALPLALIEERIMKSTAHAPIGAEITDVSLADLDRPTVAQLRVLLAEHGVLIFPGQPLDDADFLRFLRSFGELTFTKGETSVAGYPDLNVVSNVGRSTPARSTFHVDTSYVARPPAYTALRAVTIPASGGETLFSNQYRAYDTLPDDMQAKLAGRTITHVVTGVTLLDDDEQSAEHPIFRRHPFSGRIALYMSTPSRCAAISGLCAEEAETMVRYLFEHSTREDNVMRHPWAPDDVVIWDNGCVLHRADHSQVDGDRVMHRGMVAGYEPSLQRAA